MFYVKILTGFCAGKLRIFTQRIYCLVISELKYQLFLRFYLLNIKKQADIKLTL